jgi:predicted ATPase
MLVNGRRWSMQTPTIQRAFPRPELRAARTLARLWREHGRRAEARDLLMPVYGSFNEGFDTPDLQDVRAILDGRG